jgi:hypothetical protein
MERRKTWKQKTEEDEEISMLDVEMAMGKITHGKAVAGED